MSSSSRVIARRLLTLALLGLLCAQPAGAQEAAGHHFDRAAREMFNQLRRHRPQTPWTLGVQRLECTPPDHPRAAELCEEFKQRMVGALVRAQLEVEPWAIERIVDVEEVTRILAEHDLQFEEFTVYDQSAIIDRTVLPANAFVVCRVRITPAGDEVWSYRVVLYEDGTVKAACDQELEGRAAAPAPSPEPGGPGAQPGPSNGGVSAPGSPTGAPGPDRAPPRGAGARPGGPAPELHQLDEYTPRVGDRVRILERDRTVNRLELKQQGRVVRRQEQVEGHEMIYVLQVLEVDGAAIVRGVRRFERFVDLQTGEQHDVSGLVVVVRRDARGVYSSNVTAGRMPGPLARLIDVEVARRNRGEGGARNPMLPTRPVSAGESWDLPLETMLGGVKVSREDIDLGQSYVRGILTGADRAGGLRWFQVGFEMRTVFRRFQGMDCPDPIVMHMGGSLRMSPETPDGLSVMEGTMQGSAVPPNVPPGTVAAFDATFERREERSRAE